MRGDSEEILLFALQGLWREHSAARAAQVCAFILQIFGQFFEFLCCFLQVVGGLRMRAAFAADAPVEIPVEEFQGRCALGQNLALAIFVIDDVYTCMMLMIRAGCNAATCAV